MMDCDFLPADYHNRQNERRTLRRRGCFVALMVALMGVWLGLNRREIAEADWLLGDLGLQRQQLKISLVRKGQLSEERERLRAQQEIVEKLQSHVSLVVLFADISTRVPESVALTSLALSGSSFVEAPGEPAANGAKPAARGGAKPAEATPVKPKHANRLQLTMGGVAKTAPDVLAFAAALEESSLVDRVQMDLKGRSAWAGRQVLAFQLSCELKPQQGARR